MGKHIGLWSPARVAVMRALAEADGALIVTELAEIAEVPETTVRTVLVRPLRTGWVTRTWNSRQHGRFMITDAGREWLAENTDSNEERQDMAQAQGYRFEQRTGGRGAVVRVGPNGGTRLINVYTDQRAAQELLDLLDKLKSKEA